MIRIVPDTSRFTKSRKVRANLFSLQKQNTRKWREPPPTLKYVNLQYFSTILYVQYTLPMICKTKVLIYMLWWYGTVCMIGTML